MHYRVAVVGDMSKLPVCIGGYSALPAANLLALGITQARFSSALAESQLCLWSFNCGVSLLIGVVGSFKRFYKLF